MRRVARLLTIAVGVRVGLGILLSNAEADSAQLATRPATFARDVQMVEARPAKRRIVDHINVFTVPPPGAPAQKLTREERERLRIQAGQAEQGVSTGRAGGR